MMTKELDAKFHVGQLVKHNKFSYRGVVFDVDPEFSDSGEWYEMMAKSRPPKDKPWYHILVDGAEHTTYVAERNLEPDETGQPILHPLIDALFGKFKDGRYETGLLSN